uniref:Putative secreted protein n=1 Tax=Ixodes ricinus TaxID=34613 RepID=A0A6B0ULG3_IXORI
MCNMAAANWGLLSACQFFALGPCSSLVTPYIDSFGSSGMHEVTAPSCVGNSLWTLAPTKTTRRSPGCRSRQAKPLHSCSIGLGRSQCCTRSSRKGTKARSSFLRIFGTRSRYKFHL